MLMLMLTLVWMVMRVTNGSARSFVSLRDLLQCSLISVLTHSCVPNERRALSAHIMQLWSALNPQIAGTLLTTMQLLAAICLLLPVPICLLLLSAQVV